jgi:hypothetical protein
MKLCLVAALVLVVWYLMAPPIIAKNNAWLQNDIFAPLSQWVKAGAFPTKEECDIERGATFLCVSADDLATEREHAAWKPTGSR